MKCVQPLSFFLPNVPLSDLLFMKNQRFSKGIYSRSKGKQVAERVAPAKTRGWVVDGEKIDKDEIVVARGAGTKRRRDYPAVRV